MGCVVLFVVDGWCCLLAVDVGVVCWFVVYWLSGVFTVYLFSGWLWWLLVVYIICSFVLFGINECSFRLITVDVDWCWLVVCGLLVCFNSVAIWLLFLYYGLRCFGSCWCCCLFVVFVLVLGFGFVLTLSVCCWLFAVFVVLIVYCLI